MTKSSDDKVPQNRRPGDRRTVYRATFDQRHKNEPLPCPITTHERFDPDEPMSPYMYARIFPPGWQDK